MNYEFMQCMFWKRKSACNIIWWHKLKDYDLSKTLICYIPYVQQQYQTIAQTQSARESITTCKMCAKRLTGMKLNDLPTNGVEPRFTR